MLFLLEYDRTAGCLVHCEQFQDAQRGEADRARFQRELAVNRADGDHEVVLLEAPDEETLRQTHARYFLDPEAMYARFQETSAALVARERKDDEL
jgi:hypothetical protein